MKASFHKHLVPLWQNLVGGALLCVFRRAASSRFTYSLDQAIYIAAVIFLLAICVEYIEVMPDPEFNSYAISGMALKLTGLLVTAFILVKLSEQHQAILPFVIQACSATPTYYLVYTAISYIPNVDVYEKLFWAMIVWALAIIRFIAAPFVNYDKKKMIVTMGSYGLLVIGPTTWVPSGNFWYESFDDNQFEKLSKINQETLFYDQFDYLVKLKETLKPGNPQTTDLYFLGFGSYSFEDVFMKEIEYIKPLMDSKFNTQGRSIALINNLKTMSHTPLATTSNLTRVIKTIGEAMNKEDDILFVYLTSHGSRKHKLTVEFWPLDLNPVTPELLKTAMDEAGIKWRVVLVSSCYSGGYIEPLKDPHTLIFTASAHDRQSFGCGSSSDFTYFGRAVFVDQLANEQRFLPAFRQAIDSITEREKKEKRKLSLPQLYIGDAIGPKLDGLTLNGNMDSLKPPTQASLTP
jgi:hypothetical protein